MLCNGVKAYHLTPWPQHITILPTMPGAADRPINPQVGARVPEDLLIEIKVLATRQRRRFNDLVGEALQDLLKKYQGKKGLLPKGK